MSVSLADDEQLRRIECAREPVATLGTVQGRGIVFGLSHAGSDATVLAVSDSCEQFWGLRPDEVIGRPLAELVGITAAHLDHPRLGDSPRGLSFGPHRVRDHRGGEWMLTIGTIDGQSTATIEAPSGDEPDPDLVLRVATASARISQAGDIDEMWHYGALKIRRWLGFDRTIVLRFHPDGHGEVIAESRSDDVDSYLGLHFPASDVPAQARRLYEVVRSTSISDVNELPSIVVPRADPDGRPWDLTQSPLRGVSPHHLQFMRNMKTLASVTLNLSGERGLEYMIVSHSSTPRTASAHTRAQCEVFSELLFNRVSLLARTAELTRLGALSLKQRALVDGIGDAGSIADVLAGGAASDSSADSGADTGERGVLGLIRADAAIISVRGERRVIGDIDEAEITAVSDTVRGWLGTLSQHGTLLTDRVSDVHPRLAREAPGIAGLLVSSIGSQGDFICWIRRPAPHTVRWLGSLEADNRDHSLSPRRSFNTWNTEEADAAQPWVELEKVGAERLAREVEEKILRRVESELAQLALVDSLTGLPNRRLLLERLAASVAREQRGHPFALLYLDLNDFKRVNDSFGHQAGDDLLVEFARRLTSSVRAGDTVARLGGDEFVVLCDDVLPGEEQVVAERIRSVLAVPHRFTETASAPIEAAIGITRAHRGVTPAALLDRADQAMYAAKAGMRAGG